VKPLPFLELGGVYDWGAFFVVSVLSAVALVTFTRHLPKRVRTVVVVAGLLRIPAGLARLEIARQVYRSGDYIKYVRYGWEHAVALRDGSLRTMELWLFGDGNVWGTKFVEALSGLCLAIVGPSIHAEFVVFSMAGFVGLFLVVDAIMRTMNVERDPRAYVVALFFPSVIYWPSSIGKDALMLLGIGLAVSAAFRTRGISWPRLVVALGLLFAIRPHIGLLVVGALAAGEWLAPVKRWSAVHGLRAAFMAASLVAVVQLALVQFGVDESTADIGEFIEDRAERTATGGSAMTQTSGALALVMAPVNVFFRPFLWEATNPMMALAAVETLIIAIFMLRRRRALFTFLRTWRAQRLSRVVLPLTLGLVAFYGGFVSNLGILARQRVVVLPFLFCLLYFSEMRAVAQRRQLYVARALPPGEAPRANVPA